MDDAIDAYARFNEGAAQKFVIDPHNVLVQKDKSIETVTLAGPSSLGRSAQWP